MNEKIVEVKLLTHQYEFIADYVTPYLLLLGGLGSGKTWAFAEKGLSMSILNAGFSGTLMEPTGPLLFDILIPTLEEVLDTHEIRYTMKQNQQKPNYYIDCGGGKISELRLRSAENWRRQIGSNQAFIGADEIDTMSLLDAVSMMRKSKPRIRKGNHLQFFAVSTPEGFNFCYNFFEQEADSDKRTIRAKTMDNPFLPESYVSDLKKLYPENLVNAYLNGLYVNMTSGTVYGMFNRKENYSDATEDGREPLRIGMDFNIMNMAAVVFVVRRGLVYAVDEITGIYDTTSMIKALKDRYEGRTMMVYPDASGDSRHTNASQTDIDLLKAAGFYVINPKRNPFVRDRVNSMNTLFKNGAGERKLFVNTEKCPVFTRALEQQVWDESKGEPDKKSGHDHINDAAGYFIYSEFPVKRPKTGRQYSG
jgi:hypothetical protein